MIIPYPLLGLENSAHTHECRQEVAFRKMVNKMANSTSPTKWAPLTTTYAWELLFHSAQGGVQVMFVGSYVGRCRRVRSGAAQLQLNCSAAQLQLNCSAAQLQLNCSAAQLQLNCYAAQLQLNCNAAQLQLNCNAAQLQLNCSAAQLQS